MIGEVLGNYRLISELGKGGMAQVFLAEHVVIGVEAAVKVLLPNFSSNPAMIQRFVNEAKAASAVKHPGIIDVFDYGRLPNGRVYMVMEYLQGETLHRRLRREKQLPLDQALNITRQLATALKAAHRLGIIHRDLKPDNIYLVPDAEVIGGERVKILDFGIAKLAMGGIRDNRNVTQTGVIIGTPDYMSPEQCKGLKNVDHRADLYSLGCILFKLLVGRTPFADHSTGEVISCHVLKQPASPDELAPSIPPDVNRVVLKLLEKDPAYRYNDADELLTALERIGHSSQRVATGRRETSATMHGHARPADPTVHGGAPPALPVGPPMQRTRTPASTLTQAANYRTVALTGPPRPRSRKLMHYGLLAAAAMLLFGGAALSAMHFLDAGEEVALQSQTQVAAVQPPSVKLAEPDRAAPASTGIAPVVERLPPQDPEPAHKITIKISSVPKRVEIYRMPQGVRVATTPTTLSYEPIDGDYVFLLKKPGFEDYRIEAKADEDGAFVAELTPLPDADKHTATSARTAKKSKAGKSRRSQKRRRATRRSNKGDKGDNVITLDPFDQKKKKEQVLDPFEQ